MAERNLRDLRARLVQHEEADAFAALIDRQSPALGLITGIFGGSPFLSRLILSNPAELWSALHSEPDAWLQSSAATLHAAMRE
jgi:hypothetical protein